MVWKLDNMRVQGGKRGYVTIFWGRVFLGEEVFNKKKSFNQKILLLIE